MGSSNSRAPVASETALAKDRAHADDGRLAAGRWEKII